MSRVLANFSGTTSASFSIGKRGATVISGIAHPLNSMGSLGDIYVMKGSNPKFYQKHTTWVEIGTKNIHHITETTNISAIYPEEVLLVDSSNDIVDITLSSASMRVGYSITIKDIGGNASINTISINTENSEKIDGSDLIELSKDYESITLLTDGDNWYII